jgi:modulator of FtsH protease
MHHDGKSPGSHHPDGRNGRKPCALNRTDAPWSCQAQSKKCVRIAAPVQFHRRRGYTANVFTTRTGTIMATTDIRTASSTALDAGATRVLRNTYALLAMTLLFSAVTAGVSMALNVPYLGLWTLLPYFVLLFLVEKNKNSAAGLLCVFALTGWMGFSLGPILNHYVHISGFEPVFMALGGTAAVFFGLSAYVLVTRKDLSFATGFLGTGMLVAFVAAIANFFLHIPALGLALTAIFMFLSSGLIMWQTSQIIHGGERNYISATVTLYVMIYNLFSILLSFFGGSSE